MQLSGLWAVWSGAKGGMINEPEASPAMRLQVIGSVSCGRLSPVTE